MVEGTDGNLYGTTYWGGDIGGGTVFKMIPGGTLTTLYSFVDSQNGGFPQAPLIQATDGNFYGTASQGGVYGAGDGGTVFKITPDGTETTLHSFDYIDGNLPAAGLIQASDGNFYGTVPFGGNDCIFDCGGTVFKITSDGGFTLLYSFSCSQTGCPDGGIPSAGLVQGSDGNLYGTTGTGGTSTNCCGTVFKIAPDGTLTTLHSFDGTDGAGPGQLVQATDGNFYGTTDSTVFEITPAGAVTTLHYFDGTDGAPVGLIQATDGNFYGTTGGTVFRLGLGLPPLVNALPTSGPAGTPVIILGNNLTSTTSVTFNGTAAAFTVVSDTAINTTVPSGATTGQLQVTTPSGTLSSNVDFQVR